MKIFSYIIAEFSVVELALVEDLVYLVKCIWYLAGRGVSEKVSAVGFCLGSGLFGSCNSD